MRLDDFVTQSHFNVQSVSQCRPCQVNDRRIEVNAIMILEGRAKTLGGVADDFFPFPTSQQSDR